MLPVVLPLPYGSLLVVTRSIVDTGTRNVVYYRREILYIYLVPKALYVLGVVLGFVCLFVTFDWKDHNGISKMPMCKMCSPIYFSGIKI